MKRRKSFSEEEAMLHLLENVKQDADGCWIWQGPVNEWGYGYLSAVKENSAHRVMYRLVYGEIPRKMRICHTCDVRLCCNPGHLWLGTQQQNIKDCAQKGRHTNGAKTHCKQGHEYTPENTLVAADDKGRPHRHCKTCKRIRLRLRDGWTLEEATADTRPIPAGVKTKRRDFQHLGRRDQAATR